jgi:peptidoglycan/xylan/chitin deacetylase (PgdA/CDA1 family)
VPILLYHRISDDPGPVSLAEYAVPPAAFRRQMGLLRRAGFTTVGPELVVAARRGERPLPPRAVCLTFDDGYADFALHALPTLMANGQTATVYVPHLHVGHTAGWDDEGAGRRAAPLLDWPALERLVAAGCTVGSHGARHRHLTRLDDRELSEELGGSRDALEARLGVRVASLAYPYGDHDARVRAAAELAGYDTALTTDWGLSRDEPLLALRRIFVLRGDSVADFVARVLYGGDARGAVTKALASSDRARSKLRATLRRRR